MKCYSLPYILRIKGEGVEGCYNCLPLQMGGGGRWGFFLGEELYSNY